MTAQTKPTPTPTLPAIVRLSLNLGKVQTDDVFNSEWLIRIIDAEKTGDGAVKGWKTD